MSTAEHFIPRGNFDREYGLADLLDPQRVAAIFRQAAAEGLLELSLWYPDGRPFFPEGLADPLPGDRGEEPAVRLPLRHEWETVGFLRAVKGPGLASAAVEGAAACTRTVLEALMAERCRCLMTSALHGEVVEDAYLRLQEKADALAVSEARFRALAARLEVEVRRQAEEIRTTQARLMERAQLASIGQLAAGMAHEINNPLGFIISNLGTLDQYGRDLGALLTAARRLWRRLEGAGGAAADEDELRREAAELEESARQGDLDYLLQDLPDLVREAREGGERIRAIVANLKAFAQPGVHAPAALDINRCLETTLQVLAPRMGDVVPVCRLAPLPAIRGSESQIHQVLMNVILNAVQASPPGGRIRIATAVEDGRVVVAIGDEGPGIPPELHSRVFAPFYTTREVGAGCGLGLTLAYNIVQQHGGTIEVDRGPEPGATIVIRLPIHG